MTNSKLKTKVLVSKLYFRIFCKQLEHEYHEVHKCKGISASACINYYCNSVRKSKKVKNIQKQGKLGSKCYKEIKLTNLNSC